MGTPKTSFTRLSADVEDETGASVPHLRAQACGLNLCLYGSTDDRGHVEIQKAVAIERPAFKYGDGRTHAQFALPLPGGNIDVDLGVQRTVAFDAPADGAAMTAGADATSRGVTLSLAPGTDIGIDPLEFDTPDLARFRAAVVPDDARPAAVDPALAFGAVVALTPLGTTLCPAAGLTVPNTPGWPAGSRVEFLLHGVDVAEDWAPYGGWAKVSNGSVTSDGASLRTDDGAGLSLLSVVGVRLAPAP